MAASRRGVATLRRRVAALRHCGNAALRHGRDRAVAARGRGAWRSLAPSFDYVRAMAVPAHPKPDRNIALELVRITEGAAIAASRWMGRGDKDGADGAAVDAMRRVLSVTSPWTASS